MPNPQPQFLISLYLIQTLLDYLNTRPHKDVRAMYDALSMLPRAEVKPETLPPGVSQASLVAAGASPGPALAASGT